MKFAFFGYDFTYEVLERLLAEGHEWLGLFTFPCDNQFNFNQNVIGLAQKKNIPVSFERPTEQDLQAMLDKGCEVFLSAGYIYKIPPIPSDKAYGLNFHPTLLPRGRGIMPMPYLIQREQDAGGITIHKLAQNFDSGDILYQKPVPIMPTDDVETYTSKILIQLPVIIADIFANIDDYWKNAIPQDHSKASHWPYPDDDMRSFDFTKTITDIDRVGRSVGRYGALFKLHGKLYAVFHYAVWEEDHTLPPGSIACVMSREITIAAADGFVCLKDFKEISQE